MRFSEIPYERPDQQELLQQIQRLEQQARSTDSADALLTILKEVDQLQRHIRTLQALVHIRFTQDVRSEFWKNEKIFWEQLLPELAEKQRQLLAALVEHPQRPAVEQQVGERLFLGYEISLQTFDPSIKPLLLQIVALERRYTELTGSLLITFRGNQYTMSQIQPFLQDPDRETRKAAAEALWNALGNLAAELDTIYDQLVKLRHQKARKLGFDNYIQLRYLEMFRTDYTPEDVAQLRKVIRETVVPIVQQLRQEQQQWLNLDHLRIYDEALLFPSGNPQPKGDPEWILQQAKTMYTQLSDETARLMTHLVEDEFLDVLSRPGKASGGYCAYLPDYRSPFIFANFNGTIDDVRVLTHEFGHAFQQDQSSTQPFLAYMSPTLETAEIHSMGMEFLTYPWMDLFFGDEVEKFYTQHLFAAVSFLCYAAAVDEFQHRIYEQPEMSPQQRLAVWQEMEKQYLPWRDNTGIPALEQGRFWQRQLHIYRAPFYYIDYALAQLCAFQIWLQSRRSYAETFQKYQRLCQLGGRLSFVQTLQTVGLSSPFDSQVVQQTVTEVVALLRTLTEQVIPSASTVA